MKSIVYRVLSKTLKDFGGERGKWICLFCLRRRKCTRRCFWEKNAYFEVLWRKAWTRCWAHVKLGWCPRGKTRDVKFLSWKENIKIFLIFYSWKLYQWNGVCIFNVIIKWLQIRLAFFSLLLKGFFHRLSDPAMNMCFTKYIFQPYTI